MIGGRAWRFADRNHRASHGECPHRRRIPRFPQFRFWPTLSRPGEGWTGGTGHVQAHLAEALQTETGAARRDVDFYLCGLKQMVDDMRAILKGMGFDRKQILYEKYD